MSDKISGLAPMTAFAGADLLLMVDVDDATMAATGTDKQATLAQVRGGKWVSVTDYGATGNGSTDDTSAIQSALSSGAAVVYLPPGTYKYSSQLSVPEQVSLIGGGASQTILMYYGSGASVYHHGSTDSFYTTFVTVGALKGFTIDGTNASAGAAGLDAGDGWGHDVDLVIRHFNGAGSVGAWLINRVTWTEKSRWRLTVQDCTQLVKVDTASTISTSHVYSDYLFYLYAMPGQSGIALTGGSEMSLSGIRVRGNFQGDTTSHSPWSVLSVGADSSAAHIHYSRIDLLVEDDIGGTTTAPQTIVIGSSAYMTDNSGLMAFYQASAGVAFAAATLGGTGWHFDGLIEGDSTLRSVTTPGVPASGTGVTNNGQDAMVYVKGGTVTNVTIGSTATGVTSGGFLLKHNQSITLTYSSAPTWTWVTASTF